MLRLIDSLIRELSGHGNTRRGKFLMLFRPNRKMSETIYELSEPAPAGKDGHGAPTATANNRSDRKICFSN